MCRHPMGRLKYPEHPPLLGVRPLHGFPYKDMPQSFLANLPGSLIFIRTSSLPPSFLANLPGSLTISVALPASFFANLPGSLILRRTRSAGPFFLANLPGFLIFSSWFFASLPAVFAVSTNETREVLSFDLTGKWNPKSQSGKSAC
jgi:hypothetical protein